MSEWKEYKLGDITESVKNTYNPIRNRMNGLQDRQDKNDTKKS